ncbi:MAG: Mini-ribonuclease 3 [Solirubrobacterales bacterium]
MEDQRELTPNLTLPLAEVSQLSPLVLAYIGDGVFELAVRTRLVHAGIRKPDELHKAAVRQVRAEAQAALARALEPRLTEAELDLIKRGRNAKGRTPQGTTSIADYRLSTGFETLLGYHYLAGNRERLAEILDWIFALQ